MKKETEFDQLESLLRSLKTKEEAVPSMEFRQNAKIRIMNSVSPDTSSVSERRSFFSFRLALTLVLILLVLSSGTILAAQSASPKSSLYPIKIASENIALNLSPAPLKAQVAIGIVQRRDQELSKEQKTGNSQQIKQGIQRFQESINRAKTVVPENSTINTQLQTQEEKLNAIINNQEKRTEKKESTNHEENNNYELRTQSPSFDEISPSPSPTPVGQNINQSNQGQNQNLNRETSPLDNIQKGIENAFHNFTKEE